MDSGYILNLNHKSNALAIKFLHNGSVAFYSYFSLTNAEREREMKFNVSVYLAFLDLKFINLDLIFFLINRITKSLAPLKGYLQIYVHLCCVYNDRRNTWHMVSQLQFLHGNPEVPRTR